jgi:hypothetical protein
MMNWKGFGWRWWWWWPNFKVLLRYSPGGNEKKHEILKQNSRLPGPRIELGIFRKRSKSVNHSISTFGQCCVRRAAMLTGLCYDFVPTGEDM